MIRADELCEQFYRDYGTLYGDKNCGLNVHNIGTHVVDFFRTWGSVTEWSNFGYEDENGHLVKSVSGTGDVSRQLFRMKLANNAVKAVDLETFSDEKHKILLKSLQDKGKKWKNLIKMKNCTTVRATNKVDCTNAVKATLLQVCNAENINDLKVVKRVILQDRTHLYSKGYTRMKKHVSYVVLLNNGRIAQILKYYINIDTNIVYADLEYFNLALPETYYFGNFPKHLIRVRLSNETGIVDVSVIKEMLFFVECHLNDAMVCRIPNLHGHGVLK